MPRHASHLTVLGQLPHSRIDHWFCEVLHIQLYASTGQFSVSLYSTINTVYEHSLADLKSLFKIHYDCVNKSTESADRHVNTGFNPYTVHC